MPALRKTIRESLADQQHLWRRGVEDGDTDTALAAWRQGRLISLPGGHAWPVPENPDWSEDPYRNLSWAAGYQSLGWLAALARGYRDGDRSMGADLKHYVLSWIEANPVGNGQSVRSWYNGAVHRRTNALVSMMDVLLEVLDDDQLAQVLISLHQHGTELDSYLSNPRLYGHNHNLFHALALFNLVKNVPVLADASSWEQDARDRMHSLLREMVDPRDGVSTEQASAYHYVAMRLFAAAQEYLASDDDGFGESDLALLTEMTRFGALLPDPAGTLPAIGDTEFGADDSTVVGVLKTYSSLGLITPEAEYVLSRGSSGRRPADAVFFRGQGYAIFRPSYGETSSWENDLHVVVDMGPSARVHGHDDAMNVLLAAYGQQLVVDSGGPYQYGVDERRAFTDAAAHNTVIVDGGAGDRAGDATVEQTIVRPDYSAISGSHDNAPGVHHQRIVLVIKPWLVLVVDRLSATDGQPHDFDLLYHLPPQADVQAQGTTAMVTAGQVALGVAVNAGDDLSLAIRSGETNPLFGWVTTANGKREAAPVLDYSQRSASAWYVTALLPSPTTATVQPEVTAERTNSGMLIEVHAGSEHWTVRLPDGGEPNVESGQ